eukprot:scaffold19731_cov133-Isochrysis_galbana.AAC.4
MARARASEGRPPSSGKALISDLGRAGGARFFLDFVLVIRIQNTPDRQDQGLSPEPRSKSNRLESDTP